MGNPPNALRIGCALGILPACLAVAMLAPCHAFAQTEGERLALALRNNVVSLVVERPGGERHGFGIIVGERAGRLFIVTANHLVRGSDPQDLPSRIRIRYYQRRDDEYEASLLGTSDARYDIAVVDAPAPPGLEWHRESLRARAEVPRGTDVWFIGRSGGWYIPTQPGKLSRVTLDFRIHVDDLTVQVGSSGAPLMAADGIVGLLLVDETAGTSSALSIELIERAVRLWDLPWDLEPLTARAAIPSLSPEVTMHVSAGDRFLQVGQFGQAIDEFEEARKYDPRNTTVLLRVVTAMRLRLWAQAGIPFEDVLPEIDWRSNAQEIVATADRALQVLYQAQGIDTSLQNDPRWLLEESRIRRGRADWRRGLEAVERARKSAPDDPDLMSEMGLLLARITFDNSGAVPREQHARGIELLQRAVASRPDDPLLRRHLAYGLELSDAVAAVREYDRAATAPSGGGVLLESNRDGAIQALNARLARFGRFGVRPWENGLPAADVVRIAEYVRAAPNLRGSSEWSDWSRWTGLLLAAAQYELGNLTAVERVCRDLLGPNLLQTLGQRNIWDHQTPFFVLLGRVLERSGSNPAELLAIQNHLGKPSAIGAVLRVGNGKVWVDTLIGEGLAQDAGLAEGDAVVAVGNQVTPDVIALARAVAARKPGEIVELAVTRKDQNLVLRGTIPAREGAAPGARLGIVISNAEPKNRSGWGSVDVMVSEVEKDGPAARLGIAAGDRIVRINGVALAGVDHLLYLLGGFSPGAIVHLGISRNNETIELDATLAAIPTEPD